MKGFIILSIVFIQFLKIQGRPETAGIGTFIYQDSFGNRYGGSYESKDGVITHRDFTNSGDDVKNSGGNRAGLAKNKGGSEVNGFNNRPDVFNNGQGHGIPNAGFPFNFGVNPYMPNFNPGLNAYSDQANPQVGPDANNDMFNNFFPMYFSNLQRTLQQAFQSSIENQRLAFDAARRAFDEPLAPLMPLPPLPPMQSIFDDGGFRGSANSAFSMAATGGGFREQIAAISPENLDNPNIAVTAPLEGSNMGGPGYSMVASKSYVVSSNINGREVTNKGATTIVDENGKVTRYEVAD